MEENKFNSLGRFLFPKRNCIRINTPDALLAAMYELFGTAGHKRNLNPQQIKASYVLGCGWEGGGPSVAAAPGRQSPRGGKLSISDEKEIRFSALNKLRIIHQNERKFNK
jgi:hypothetical protein